MQRHDLFDYFRGNYLTKSKQNMKTNKILDEINTKIIELLDKGVNPWQRTWEIRRERNGLFNAVTGYSYSGINSILTAIDVIANEHETGQYITFNQARKAGLKIKKGSKAVKVIFWKILTKENPDTGKDEKIPLLKYYNVFNIDCLESIPDKFLKPAAEQSEKFQTIDSCETVLNGWTDKPQINHGGNRAFYSPKHDFIQMPKAEQFKSEAAYYSTLFHESIHATGHKSRVNRGLNERLAAFGSVSYAKEELIAEIGALGLCYKTGIENGNLQNNSAAYLQGWAKKLKEPDNRHWLHSASSKAEKAINHILGDAAN